MRPRAAKQRRVPQCIAVTGQLETSDLKFARLHWQFLEGSTNKLCQFGAAVQLSCNTKFVPQKNSTDHPVPRGVDLGGAQCGLHSVFMRIKVERRGYKWERPRAATRSYASWGAEPRVQSSAHVRKWSISEDTENTLDCGCDSLSSSGVARLVAVSVKPIAREIFRDD